LLLLPFVFGVERAWKATWRKGRELVGWRLSELEMGVVVEATDFGGRAVKLVAPPAPPTFLIDR